MNLRMYFHFLHHVLRLRLSKRHRIPLTVNVQLLLRCNSDCLYCAQAHNDKTELSFQTVAQVCDEAWDMGTRRLHFTGGEPLLRGDLYDIVRYAKDKGFYVSIATNGFRCKEQSEALKLVDQVLLSFDGPYEIRELLCGKRSAQISEEAAAFFTEEGIPFWTTTVINTKNIPHIEWIVTHAKEHGAHANFVLLETQPEAELRLHPRVAEVKDLLPSQEENRRAVEEIVRLKRKGLPVGSSLPYLEELAAWNDYTATCSPQPSPKYRCVAWRSSCELLANGELYSCSWPLAHGRGVSIYEQGFAKAFSLLPPITDCQSCVGSCYLEQNLIFNFNLRTIWNWVTRM